jgi:hypothetical protein
VRHERYGTTIAQFGPVGEALLDTLAKCTGDAFTPEVQDAWVEVYSLILTGKLPHLIQHPSPHSALAIAKLARVTTGSA